MSGRKQKISKEETYPQKNRTVSEGYVEGQTFLWISQVLTPMYEPQFSDNSYGFRPRRSAHGALRKRQEYITEGYTYTVDLDLEKFFDTVQHSKLIEVLSRTIHDGRVISLIHKYLNAGVQVGSKLQTDEGGVPQGGPLSPILSNVMLNEMDKELERRKHKFV